jgi:hypothetical protein
VEFEQCVPSREPHDAAVFGDESNYNHHPTTVFFISHAMQLLAAFPRLNIQPKCHCFLYVREIQQTDSRSRAILRENFNRCFKHNSWNTYIYAERQNFKGVYLVLEWLLSMSAGGG